MHSAEAQYLDIMANILDKGAWKTPTRENPKTKQHEPIDGGIRTLMLPNQTISCDLSEGFPLLTSKQMIRHEALMAKGTENDRLYRKSRWYSILVELQGFIGGITSKQWYKDRDCHIWDQWARPSAVVSMMNQEPSPPEGWTPEAIKDVKKRCDDLGPIYGAQWRRFDDNPEEGDQLMSLVHKLRYRNHNDRRMVVSAWNPNELHEMGLHPCHFAFDVTCSGDFLNLAWMQRSCDWPLGVPFNIASYAVLTHLLAAEAGLRPGNLLGVFVDAHIYENQIEACKVQLGQGTYVSPELEIYDTGDPFDIFKWQAEDVALSGYTSSPAVSFPPPAG